MCYWWITRKLITSISDLSFDSCIHPWTSAVIKIVRCIFIILKPFSEGAVHIEVEQQVWKWLSALPAGARTCCDITFCCAGEAHQRVLNGGAHSWLEEVGPESTYPSTAPLQLLGQNSYVSVQQYCALADQARCCRPALSTQGLLHRFFKVFKKEFSHSVWLLEDFETQKIYSVFDLENIFCVKFSYKGRCNTLNTEWRMSKEWNHTFQSFKNVFRIHEWQDYKSWYAENEAPYLIGFKAFWAYLCDMWLKNRAAFLLIFFSICFLHLLIQELHH